MLTFRVLASAVAALVILAVPATAQETIPPGNSGADEYTEGVPGPGGEQPTGPNNGGGGGEDSPPLPSSTASALGQAGAGGALVQSVVGQTAPDSQALRDAVSGKGEKDGEAVAAGAADDSSPLDSLAAVGTGADQGLGAGLPALLVGALLAAGAFVLVRRLQSRRP